MKSFSCFSTINDAGHRLTEMAFDLAEIQARFQMTHRVDMMVKLDLNVKLQELESRMCRWRANLLKPNSSWQFHVLEVVDSPQTWNQKVHHYHGGSVRIWNMWRMLRIILGRTWKRTMLCASTDYQQSNDRPLLDQIAETQQALADEVCASIQSQLALESVHQLRPVLSANRCMMPLVWAAIGLIECQQAESVAQIEWIVGRLEYIARHFGIRKALAMANDVRIQAQRLQPTDGSLYFPFR